MSYERLRRAKSAIPLQREHDYPCPGCGRQVPTFRTDATSILVGCDYDCGPRYMHIEEWFDYYDEWEPTE